MLDKNSQIATIKMAEYDPPQKVERPHSNGKWVEYGYDNKYPDYLLDLYRNSPTNHAVIDKMVQMITGKGIHSKVADGNEKLRSLGINDDIDKINFDYYVQGGAYLKVVLNKKDEPLSAEHLAFENTRLAIDDDGEVIGVFYSEDWEQYRKDRFAPEFYPLYDPNRTDAESVIILQKTTPGSIYYPSPSYEGAVNYIELEINIGIYHVNQILNGLMPSFIVNFRNGIPTLEERNKIVRDLELKSSGAKNAGKFLTLFSEAGVDNKTEFESFPLSDADKQYQFLSEECTDKIMRSHRVSSQIIFGVDKGGGLGNNANEMDEAKRQLEEDVVFPDRRAILKQLKPLFDSVGIVPDWNIDNEDAETDSSLAYDKSQTDTALTLLEKYNASTITLVQARTFCVSFLGFDEAAAERLFPDEQLALSEKKKPELTDEWGSALVDGLSQYGETIEDLDADGWELVHTEDAGCHEDEANLSLDNIIGRVNLASIESYASPADRSEWGDSGLYKLRYRYSQNLSANSRSFCTKMVALSQSGVIFKKEDIDAMSQDPTVNGQFAPQGLSTYDIFDWKGGVYCHHKFERLIFFRKRGANGAFLPRSTTDELENDKRVANVPFVPRKGFETIAPINTPSRGSLKNP